MRPKAFIDMTIDLIKSIISKGETRTLELKKSTGELKDAMHSLCAFLNTDGGILVFGVAPSSLKIEGQIVSDKTRQEIAIEMRKIEPFVNIPVEYLDVPDGMGKQLIVIEADKHLWGSGAQRIIDLCHNQGLPEPQWIAKNGTITIVFQRTKETQAEVSNAVDKQAVIDTIGGKLAVFGDKLAVSGGAIVKLAEVYLFVKANPNCNSDKVAAMLNRGKSTARNYLHILTELEMIKPRGTFKDRTYAAI